MTRIDTDIESLTAAAARAASDLAAAVERHGLPNILAGEDYNAEVFAAMQVKAELDERLLKAAMDNGVGLVGWLAIGEDLG